MKRLLILFYILSTSVLLGRAQTPRYYSADEHLTNSLTTCMMQDSRGFLWTGTRYGLTRYDGHRFRHFTHQSGDSLTLSENNVLCIAERSDDTILIGTSCGMDAYDYRSQAFQRVRMLNAEGNDISFCAAAHILPLSNGEIWIAAQGWGIFRMKKGEQTARHDSSINFTGFADILQIAEGIKGDIWMLTGRMGVCRLTMKADGTVQSMQTYLENDAKQAGLTRLIPLPDGGLMVGSDYGGMFRYDVASDRFTALPQTRHLAVSAFLVDSNGKLLIGTNGHGLQRYNLSDNTFVPASYFHKELDLPSVKVSNIVEDHDGNLWLACYQKGLFMQPGHHSGFQVIGRRSEHPDAIGSHCVMSLLTTKDGTLWIGTDNDGLYKMVQGTPLHYAADLTIMGMTEEDEESLWLATYNHGCGLFSTKSGKYLQLDCTKQGNRIHCMDVSKDQEGNLWIATNGEGVLCRDSKTGLITQFYNEPHDPGRPNMLCNNWVNVVQPSADGHHLFIGTSNGMMALNLRSRLFDDYLGECEMLHGSAIRAVREDEKGLLWIATSNGLCRINPEDKSLQRLTMKEGLPADDVTSIEVANGGSLWIGTLYGLSHYDSATGRVVNYFVDSGLQGNEYSNGASCSGTADMLFFGGSNGVSLFHSSQVGRLKDSLQVHLTGLTLNGKEVTETMRSGWKPIMEGTVMDCRRYDFAYEDNTFTFDLSTMNFTLAGSLRYAWRINKGSWTLLPQGVNELTMNHLAPGSYHIDIKAVTGETESSVLPLQVTVRPPLYATWWAYLCYVLLMAGAIWWFFANRQRREQDRLRLQEHIHAAEMKEQQLQQLVTDKVHTRILEDKDEEPVVSPDEELLERVVRVVNQHLNDSDLNVEFLASEVALSRSQLHRRLKAITNQSVGDFIRSVRLKHAAQLLEKGHQNISELAYHCGFETPSSFSTAFKKFYGVPPSEFMKRSN